MAEDAPIVVLCNARTGSTLLRYLLDTHPHVAAPPETHLGALCASVRQFASDVPGGGPALAAGRDLVTAVMAGYARERGKRIWCDKSVATLDHIDAVAEVLPHARYVCLHRHAMDAIASGLEASKWGYARYGFRGYIRQRPDSAPAALAQYWIDRTTRMVEFERSGRCATRRIRYEDLVADPERELGALLADLGLARGPELVARIVAEALRTRHDPGAGDYKIDFSSTVVSSSVGSGRAVPVMLLERRQRREMNALLELLGYEPVGDDWNTGATASPAAPPPTLPAAPAQAAQDRIRDQVVRAMTGILAPRLGVPAGGPAVPVSFDIAYADQSLEHWTADPGAGLARRETNGAPGTYRLRAEVFLELASGALGFGNAVRANLVHRSRPDDNQEADRMASHLFGGVGHGTRA